MKTPLSLRFLPATGLVVLAALLSSCALLDTGPRKTEKSSSVVDFLYPKQAEPLIEPGIPTLRLPLRVGLAFVPTGQREGWTNEFSEAQKNDLLKRVAAEFKASPFIQSIDIVPTSYLRAGGGFANLDQVRGLLGLDIIVLVAYDQLQFTDQNKLSLTYWTIVGAYLFHGNKNDTHTLLEAVVYDIPSRKLLFRAPGSNQMQAGSTLVEANDRLRHDSSESFNKAADDLIANLKLELAAFRERAKKAPDEVKIETRPGYNAGGAIGGELVGVLALLGGVRFFWARKKERR